MANKRPKPEEIVSKLRQVEILMGQGMSRLDAIRQIGVVEQTYYRWKKKYGGMGVDQLKELKRLQKENERLRKAVSDLTLDKLILTEAAILHGIDPRSVQMPAVVGGQTGHIDSDFCVIDLHFLLLGSGVAIATLGLRREAGGKRSQKPTAGAAKRASGDRLFLGKCARGSRPSLRARD